MTSKQKTAKPDKAYSKARQKILRAAKTGAFDLRLEHLGLQTLPPEIGKCSRLGFLHLSNNKLTTLPRELAKCKSLEWLDLDHNDLHSIPSVVPTFPELRAFG
jgi:Leucine-rich repeat (LRR) protein